jgi:hypothetical protein
MQELNPADATFIAQQDGEVEKEFTSKVNVFFEESKANLAAYLCRVHYGDPKQVSVAVCLASPVGEQMELVEGISKIFREMFGQHEHVDIMFIGEEQQRLISDVCRPFYNPSGDTSPA